MPDIDASDAQAAIAVALQNEIWAATLVALKDAPSQATIVVIPALNQMIDVTTTRAIAQHTHTPRLIFVAVLFLTLACSLLAGFVLANARTRNVWVYIVTFAVMMTLTIYIIFDLDYPRFGIIRLDFADKALFDVLAGMK